MEYEENVSQLLIYHDLIAGIVTALDARDPYTSDHSERVAEMTQAICGFLRLSEQETTLYHISAHLHDIGKIGIEDAVLRKAGALNADEWARMREHPAIGGGILIKIRCFERVACIVRAHHERWDGRGYPDGLSGGDIPFGARIITVADSIDAMLSTRPYRQSMSAEHCRDEIEKNIGLMYDPRIAKAVLSRWEELLCRREHPCPWSAD